MSLSLLLDLGASRLKVALYDRETRNFVAQNDVAAPVPVFGSMGEIEVPADSHGPLVRALCEQAIAAAGLVPENAFICSEMHGFALAAKGQQSTYVSWRDERAARSGVLATLHEQVGADFRRITGMKLRAGLPFVTLVHMARQGSITADGTLLSLPELVISQLGQLSGYMDETMACGLGLYDLEARAWSPQLLALLGHNAPRLLCPIVAGQAPIGTITLCGAEIPVMAAVGDLQAAVHGSYCPPGSALCVNIGTGSQVNRISYYPKDLTVEERPFFHGFRMATLSHIPAGRALRVFESFFASFSDDDSGFWSLAQSLSAEEVAAAPLSVDLNCFAGAWRYRGGGLISGILEGNFTVRTLIASIIKSMVEQYLDAIALLDPDGTCDEIRLAGGVPRLLPALCEMLAQSSPRRLAFSPGDEETLLGLARLAVAY
jgi:sugar (pentulose or hexulose) kinase